ncbi:MAG: extracellular solute-binding protein, partial [Brachybacterium tyrofermentans]
ASLEQSLFATGKCAFQQVPSSQILTFQDSSGDPLQLLRMPARTSGEANMVNKASMYWSIGAKAADSAAAADLTSFLLTDKGAAEVLKIERGIPAFPEIQEAVRPLLSENELVSLDFAQMMQEEVVKPPVVTPASGVGFGDEYTRLAEEALFQKRSASDVADEMLEILTGMQPES